MSLTKLKIGTLFLLAVTLLVTSSGLIGFQTPAAGLPNEKKDGKSQSKKSEEKSSNLVRVASQLEGIVEFIGAEIKPGEKVSPEKLITLKVGSEKKRFRRLTKGDAVVEGQLLAKLDDRLAQAELTTRKGKVASCKAILTASKAIADKAEAQYAIAEKLRRTKAITPQDFRIAKLTRDKMWLDSIEKREAWSLAQLDDNVSQIIYKQNEIRSRVNGVIARICKHPGEAVRELETVLEIEILPPAPEYSLFQGAQSVTCHLVHDRGPGSLTPKYSSATTGSQVSIPIPRLRASRMRSGTPCR